MERTPKQAGEIVAARRRELGVDVAELARDAQVDVKTIRSLETGERMPRDSTKAKLERALEWTPGSIDLVFAGEVPTVVDAPPMQARGEVNPPRSPRRHDGAWELGPELMVELDLVADDLESAMHDASGATDEDDVDDLVAYIDALVTAADDILPVIRAVTTYGVGGRTRLVLEKTKERNRRQEARRRRTARPELRAHEALEPLNEPLPTVVQLLGENWMRRADWSVAGDRDGASQILWALETAVYRDHKGNVPLDRNDLWQRIQVEIAQRESRAVGDSSDSAAGAAQAREDQARLRPGDLSDQVESSSIDAYSEVEHDQEARP
ncbi:helix-turn-helix domain-containing protein [Tsukamurella ocularis]